MSFGPASPLPPAGRGWRRLIVTICAAVFIARTVSAQSGSMVRGRVLDPSNAGIPAAVVHLDHTDTGVRTSVSADASGEYTVPALPLGDYRLEVSAPGFQTRVVGPVKLEVGRTVVLDLQLPVRAIVEEVSATAPLVDLASVSVGQVIDHDAVHETPLNGRHLLDLVALVPGTPTPPQNGFSTTPSRGLGALATLTGGSREDAVSFIINGVALNNQAFNSVPLQPSVEIVQEFKVDNSTFSAEFGQSAGAVVNIVTRSGANTWHGGLFDFLRDDSLDARNYFEVTSPRPAPFARYQFGGTLGGRIVRNRTFFFFSYEAVRQRQRLTLNSVVPTDAQRASVTDAVVARLLPFVPRVNFVDEQGLPRYVGAADAEVSSRQIGLDVTHAVRPGSRIQGYYGENPVRTNEPNVRGNTIPGFGHTFQGRRHIATAAATQAIRAGLMNETRVGFYHVNGTNTPNALIDPRDYGFRVGVDAAIGLPQMNIAGGALNVGGPNNFPNGRSDTTVVVADSMTYLRGRHALKAGGEYRRFFTDAFARDPGLFTFPSVDAFLSGVANAFSVTLGDRSSHIRQGALGGFVQDNFRLSPAVTLDLGLRVDWNMTPVERDNRFIVFDPASVSLLRVGTDLDQVYQSSDLSARSHRVHQQPASSGGRDDGAHHGHRPQ